MWHMDTKVHSLSMWMHNLDTLANLDKSGVCNQANLDKADTPVDTIRSQKDNTNTQLQPTIRVPFKRYLTRALLSSGDTTRMGMDI